MLAILLILTACSDSNDDTSYESRLQAALDSSINSLHPGMVMHVKSPQGEWTMAAGMANLATETPMAPTNRLRIGSCTKTFTAAACMLLVEDDLLALDSPMTEYLPDTGIPHADEISVTNLLNMTSGIACYLNADDWILDELIANPDRQFQPQELIDHAISYTHPDSMFIGTRWGYSNTNYLLLTLIIEQCSGMSYNDYIQQRIVAPLGMAATTVAEEPVDMAHGYLIYDTSGEGDDVTSWNPTYVWGAGCVVSSASDLAHFTGALFNGKMVSDESLQQMLDWFEVAPEFSYGLGVGCYPYLGIRGHNGEVLGYSADNWYHPATGSVITVLASSNRVDGDFTFALVQKVMDILGLEEDSASGGVIVLPTWNR